MFAFEPDAWQAETLQECEARAQAHRYEGMRWPWQKTALLAIIGWHRLTRYAGKGEHPKGAVVSVTKDNLSPVAGAGEVAGQEPIPSSRVHLDEEPYLCERSPRDMVPGRAGLPQDGEP